MPDYQPGEGSIDPPLHRSADDSSVNFESGSGVTRTPVISALALAVIVFVIAISGSDPAVKRAGEQAAPVAAQPDVAVPGKAPGAKADDNLKPDAPQDRSQPVPPSTRESENAGDPDDSRIVAVLWNVSEWLGVVLIALFVAYEIYQALLKKIILAPLVAMFGIALCFLGNWIPVTSFGMTVAAVAIVSILHRLHSQRFQRSAVLLGLLLGLLAFWCAIVGISYKIQRGSVEESPEESVSIAVYEATQVLMMNMSPHDPEETAEAKQETQPETAGQRKKPAKSFQERGWFTASRYFATFLALFIAYQALTYFARNAMYQARLTSLGWHATFGSPQACLICGIGHVGLRLIRELREQGRHVIAIEKNEDQDNLPAAIDSGAIVLVADATHPRVVDELPLMAITDLYVVCGDDALNLEVAMNLRRAFAELQKPPRLNGWTISKLAQSISKKLVSARKPPERDCYVQIINPDMQSVLQHQFHTSETTDGRLQFHTFNADQNGVRNLVTDELTPLRPTKPDEVALYVVIGFDDRWEEVVLGLAQLAHFENRKRSRILVLTEDPERDAKSFLTRYPRLTVDHPVRSRWSDVEFNPLVDEWSCTFAGTIHGRTDAELPVADVKLVDRPAGSTDTQFLRCFFDGGSSSSVPTGYSEKHAVFVRPASETMADQLQARHNIPSVNWFEIEGFRPDIHAWLASHGMSEGSVFTARQWGLEFATQTLFSKLPDAPGDDDFLGFLHRLIDLKQYQAMIGSVPRQIADDRPLVRRVKPVLVVAGRDDKKNFTWANTFARSWERYRGRHGVQPPACQTAIVDITDLSVFVWISGQKPLRDLLDGKPGRPGAIAGRSVGAGVIQNGCRSFGDPDASAGRIAIHEAFRQFLSQAAANAYSAVMKTALTTPSLKDPERYDHLQSNYYAADHAMIKLAMLLDLESWKTIASECRKSQPPKQFDFTGWEAKQTVTIRVPDVSSQQISHAVLEQRGDIPETEHNRWCAELLLRNTIWRPIEPPKQNLGSGVDVRFPEAIHIRKTLVPWDHLQKSRDVQELRKDIQQVWFILNAFEMSTNPHQS